MSILPSASSRPWLRWCLVGLLLLLGVNLFVNRALINAERVNTDMDRTDQGAYINYAEWMVKDPNFVGPRNRMPAFPYILSKFRDLEETDEAFFEKAKIISITITVIVVALLGVVFFLTFSLHTAINLTFLCAFFVFLFRAAYVQAEVLYFFLSFLAFFSLWKLFTRPSSLWALAGGVLLGLAHLTKASVLPGVLTFGVFYVADALWRAVRSRQWKPAVHRLAVATVVIVAFVATIYPYIKNSKEIYGHYFYNVNSTFYIWCDSWEEAKDRTRAFGDRVGWPNVPAEQLPSASNYFRTHTPEQILKRITTGAYDLNGIMIRSYGYYPMLWIYVGFLVALVVWRWRLCWRVFSHRPMPILALVALFTGYYILGGWYTQIISGNRIILSLFLPFIFTLAAATTTLGGKRILSLGSLRVNGLLLLNITISIYLLIDIYLLSTIRILRFYGGS